MSSDRLFQLQVEPAFLILARDGLETGFPCQLEEMIRPLP